MFRWLSRWVCWSSSVLSVPVDLVPLFPVLVAVLLALVALGPVQALIMLGIVLLVQQLESHILQPLIMGKAVSLHRWRLFSRWLVAP